MKNLTYSYTHPQALRHFMAEASFRVQVQGAKSVFIMIYSSTNDRAVLKDICGTIQQEIPHALIAGSTTVGEISAGLLCLGSIVISFSFFDTATLRCLSKHCPEGNEKLIGLELTTTLKEAGDSVAGVMLLGTPQSINVTTIFDEIRRGNFGFPFFGGGAGFYDPAMSSLVFSGTDFFAQGVIAVVFISSELHIFAKSYLGWNPLSREMTITEADDMIVSKVDDMPAYDLYKKYLNIKQRKDFFMNVLEFPFLIERDGFTVARVPFNVHEDGAVGFLADVREGDHFRIGYGNPDQIMKDARALQAKMSEFKPDSIFIFSCLCRRFLLQNDVDLETSLFEQVAPTTGFYTYGEYISHKSTINVLNSTIVVVGMREGPAPAVSADENEASTALSNPTVNSDPYSEKHNRILSNLLHFINVQTNELEEINAELSRLSATDKLTQTYNRLKLDAILDKEIMKTKVFQSELSIIMLDIDNFKRINDTFGHLAGDRVLRETAKILTANIRKTDAVGRWGGEEFMMIFPAAALGEAYKLAENIRIQVETHDFADDIRITCSIGVAACQPDDTIDSLIKRADIALYKAKNAGKDRTEMS